MSINDDALSEIYINEYPRGYFEVQDFDPREDALTQILRAGHEFVRVQIENDWPPFDQTEESYRDSMLELLILTNRNPLTVIFGLMEKDANEAVAWGMFVRGIRYFLNQNPQAHEIFTVLMNAPVLEQT
jgi:hypothetical protein